MVKDAKKVLVKSDVELPGLLMAFTTYATGHYSDADIADLLNVQGYLTKKGRPFSKDTVRVILQNPIYLGRIKYQQTGRNADRSRSYAAPIQWFEGQHEAVIDSDLFEKCQRIRAERAVHRQATPKYNPYLLRGIVYCYRCCNSMPENVPNFPAFGKMRSQAQELGHRYYRCRAKDFNHICQQKAVRVEKIDEQVISILKQLRPPAEWRLHIAQAMSEALGEQNLEERLKQIREAIERMDFRWDQGFITDKIEYLEKRVKLQQDLEQLIPIPENDLERAADMLENFADHWDACGDDIEAQHRLLKLIVERVYVQDDEVVAITLLADYHIVLGHNANGSTEVSIDPFLYTCGADGI